MANIIDYLKWRGDLSFACAPFCEVDNLLLACLAYVKLDGIVPGMQKGSIAVKEASELFFQMHSREELEADRSFVSHMRDILKEMAISKRYRNARLQNYVSLLDREKELQFAAMEIKLEDGTSYIAFRGTDDTLTGWKEDFNLSNGIVPAQVAALHYLTEAAEGSNHCIRVGGHSKGGNLAVYAAAQCKEALQETLTAVYDNDGPGFDKDFLQTSGYRNIKPLIKRIIPECSVIGMLLEHDVEPEIISSDKIGILQHDGLSWEVVGTTFVRSEALDKHAVFVDGTLRKWINQMDKQERDTVIDHFFSVLESTGAETLTQLEQRGVKNIPAMIRAVESLNAKKKEEQLKQTGGH